MQTMHEINDPVQDDLRPFGDAGGKMIIYQGWGDISESPYRTIAKTERPAHKAQAMTRKETEQFLDGINLVCEEWYPFFLTALRSGLRKGELIALKWGDIQFGASADDSNRFSSYNATGPPAHSRLQRMANRGAWTSPEDSERF